MPVDTTKAIALLIGFLIVGMAGIYISEEIVSATNITNTSSIENGIDLSRWIEQNTSVPYTGVSTASITKTQNSGVVLINNNVINSTDNGKTWNALTETPGWSGTMAGASIVSFPNNHIIIFGGTNNETWRSSDEGLTWEQMNSSPQWTARNGGSTAGIYCGGGGSGTIIYAGGQDTDGGYSNETYKSIDEGLTWETVNISSGWSKRAYHTILSDPATDYIYIMGGQQTDIGEGDMLNDTWRSTDGGVTWELISQHAEWSSRDYISGVLSSEKTIYLIGGRDSNETWTSTDMGETWTQINMQNGWVERTNPAVIITPDQHIMVVGGNSLSDVWITAKNMEIVIGSSLFASQLDIINTFLLGITLLKVVVLVLISLIIFFTLEKSGLIPKLGEKE